MSAADPRLQRVLDVLDELDEYGAEHGSESIDIDGLALDLITAAIRGPGAVEIERMKEVIALLWADNHESNFSDEEERRGAMLAIAERAHRIVCRCCRAKHSEQQATVQ